MTRKRTDKDRAYMREWKQRQRQVRRELNLCEDCGEPKHPRSKSFCAECLRRRRETMRKRLGLSPLYADGKGFLDHLGDEITPGKARTAQGLCIIRGCGKPLKPTSSCFCVEHQDQHNTYHRQLRHERIKAGLCWLCGKDRERKDRASCEACLKRTRERQRKRYQRLKTECTED